MRRMTLGRAARRAGAALDAGWLASPVVDELEAEQEHLELTWKAYDRLLRALRRGSRAGNEFAEEVLDAMRRERVRRYTAASGPLYFGRIDDTGGGAPSIRPPPLAAQGNEPLALHWRGAAPPPLLPAPAPPPP